MRLNPTSATTTGGWSAAGGAADLKAGITGAGKTAEEPTAPTDVTKTAESTTENLKVLVVKPELPSELKAALEAGRKLLSVELHVYSKPGANKRQTLNVVSLFGNIGENENAEGGGAQEWFKLVATKARVEEINSLVKWEALEGRITHTNTTQKIKVYEVYFVVTWEAAAFKDSMSGSLSLGGASTEKARGKDSGTGSIIGPAGSSVEKKAYRDTREGAVVASGSATEKKRGVDSGTGTLATPGGTGVGAQKGSDSRSGAIASFGGSGIEAWNRTGTFSDHGSGGLTLSGSSVEASMKRDAGSGSLSIAGGRVERWRSASSGTGLVVLVGGAGVGHSVYKDTATGGLSVHGSGHEGPTEKRSALVEVQSMPAAIIEFSEVE